MQAFFTRFAIKRWQRFRSLTFKAFVPDELHAPDQGAALVR